MLGRPAADSTRKHHPSLDGLRGFAAFSVLLYHLGHWLGFPALATNSGLAVDLFFCLSGYVLPLAYQRHTATLTTPQFLRTRIIRLMPLVLLAIAISAPYVVVRNELAGAGVPWTPVAMAVLLGMINLPYFGAPKAIGGPELFPLNGPQYTLFLELVVNALWWATRRLDQRRLAAVLACCCFVLLLPTGLGGDIAETFWSGFPRVGASFFAGVALFHFEARVPNWRAWTAIFWSLFAVMAALFYFPFEAPLALQLFWVAVLSPLLVLAGTRARLSTFADRVCLSAGALSYPVYCLHYPIFSWVNGLYRARFGPQNLAIEGPLVIALALVLSFAALKLYDEPLRRLLATRSRRARGRRHPTAPLPLTRMSEGIVAETDD